MQCIFKESGAEIEAEEDKSLSLSVALKPVNEQGPGGRRRAGGHR